MKNNFALISLGCPKNLVDSETFCYIAVKHGYKQSDEIKDVDFVIINTCSFIQDAVIELTKVLHQISKLKAKNKVRRIFVTGCIMKRYLREMQTKFPEVDEWINIRDYAKFETLIADSKLNQYKRIALSDGPYSYLKISDGCSNNCTYCTIPSIRGKLHSSKNRRFSKGSKDPFQIRLKRTDYHSSGHFSIMDLTIIKNLRYQNC